MLHMKRNLMVAAAGVLAALMVFPAYGASRKPIKSINLTIKAEIKPDTDFGDELIERETSSNKYSVDGYEILNDDVEWREDTVPRIQITLTANDDYYFQSLPKDKVTIKGGAEFKNSKREDSSTTLLMDVELQALNTSLHALTNVVLTEDGRINYDDGHQFYYGGLALTGLPAQLNYNGVYHNIVQVTANGFEVYYNEIYMKNWHIIVESNLASMVFRYFAVG